MPLAGTPKRRNDKTVAPFGDSSRIVLITRGQRATF
jgi:hypothetical protein